VYTFRAAQEPKNIRLSKNFDASEFACSHCGDVSIVETLVSGLQRLRDILASPIHITSAYRCPKHELTIARTSKSVHSLGLAADFNLGHTKSIVDVFILCVPLFHRVGMYQTQPHQGFIHVDMDTSRPKLYWLNNRVPTNSDAYEYYPSILKINRAIVSQKGRVDWSRVLV